MYIVNLPDNFRTKANDHLTKTEIVVTINEMTTKSFENFKSKHLTKSKSTPYNIAFEELPTLTIKSYYQTSLMQTIRNLLASFAAGWTAGQKMMDNPDQSILEKLAEETKTVISALSNGLTNIHKVLADAINGIVKINASTRDPNGSLLTLPYGLMKCLLATQAQSTIKIPLATAGGFIMQSDGSYGWKSVGTDVPFGASDNITGKIFRTLAVNITPMFSPVNGGGESPTITMQFDLINDTIEKFEKNLKTVKALTLQNMWVQYGLVQAPGALYDIVIGELPKKAGEDEDSFYSAMYMCTANIKITSKGVIRKYQNEEDKFKMGIPDAFHVEMSFRSLLPNNLNSYLFATYRKMGEGNESILDKFLKAASEYMNKFKAASTVESRSGISIDPTILRPEQADQINTTNGQIKDLEDDLKKKQEDYKKLSNQLSKEKDPKKREELTNELTKINDDIAFLEAQIDDAERRLLDNTRPIN